MKVLRALERTPAPLSLTAIAAETRMTASKAYTYLATFTAEEMVAHDPSTGLYSLGRFATQLGLTALRQADVVKYAAPELVALREATACAACLFVWGNRGPSIAMKFDGDHQGSFAVRVGHVVSLEESATGRLFQAFLPRSVVEKALRFDAAVDSEPARRVRRLPSSLPQILDDIRNSGVSIADTEGANGYVAIALPVFDYSGQIVASITLLGPSSIMATDRRPELIEKMRCACERLTETIGGTSMALGPKHFVREGKRETA